MLDSAKINDVCSETREDREGCIVHVKLYFLACDVKSLP